MVAVVLLITGTVVRHIIKPTATIPSRYLVFAHEATKRTGAVPIVLAPPRPLKPGLACAAPLLCTEARVAEPAPVRVFAEGARDAANAPPACRIAGEAGCAIDMAGAAAGAQAAHYAAPIVTATVPAAILQGPRARGVQISRDAYPALPEDRERTRMTPLKKRLVQLRRVRQATGGIAAWAAHSAGSKQRRSTISGDIANDGGCGRWQPWADWGDVSSRSISKNGRRCR